MIARVAAPERRAEAAARLTSIIDLLEPHDDRVAVARFGDRRHRATLLRKREDERSRERSAREPTQRSKWGRRSPERPRAAQRRARALNASAEKMQRRVYGMAAHLEPVRLRPQDPHD